MSEYIDSPREWGTLGTMNTWIRQYRSPDEHKFDSPDDLFEYLAELDDNPYHMYERIKTDQLYRDWIQDKAEEKAIILPVYCFQHGNIAFNTTGFSCPWDSGLAGFIYVTKEDIREEFGIKRITKSIRKKVEEILAEEVDLYSKWASGEMDEEFLNEVEEEHV